MDPASASIALVGFAASLATLAAVVIDSSKTLYNVRTRLRDAPKDIKRLSRKLKEFEALVAEVQDKMQRHRFRYTTSFIKDAFESAAEQMYQDMTEFGNIIEKLKGLLDTSSSSPRLLALRIRYILDESTVQEYQRLISSHVGTLALLLGMLNK